jgi:hypothetical protein
MDELKKQGKQFRKFRFLGDTTGDTIIRVSPKKKLPAKKKLTN